VTRPRIGVIVPRFAPFRGGVETYTAQAAAALAAKGAEVTVVTQAPRGSGLPASEAHDGYTVERHRLPLRDIFDVPSVAAVRAAWQPNRFDVMWLHSYHTPLAWLASQQATAPVVLTPHYHGGGHTPVRQALHRPYRPAGRRLLSVSQRIVVDTEAEADLVARDFPEQALRSKIAVVPLGVADPVGGQEPAPLGGSPLVLTVARQEPYKRTDILVRAIVELRNRAVPVRLVVVGDGPALADVQRLVMSLRADDVVTIAGAVDESTLRRWWASADVYATASTHEAFGIGFAQALVAGLPVVASDIPAHREVSRIAGPDARVQLCGTAEPDFDHAAHYADAIASLLAEPGSRSERAARCTLPSISEMADQLLDTLTSVMR
jgi:glycosyltransferase involved in cell wall biosynthesis